jgi:CMP-2-keto-3-deoxyoctulosonic acid synthetase
MSLQYYICISRYISIHVQPPSNHQELPSLEQVRILWSWPSIARLEASYNADTSTDTKIMLHQSNTDHNYFFSFFVLKTETHERETVCM